MFDFIAVSGTTENRVTEFVDHLHEHFMEPVVITSARYMPPIAPGYSAEIKRSSRRRYQLPNGEAWRPAS
jgi:L-fuconate dehydratase